MLAVSMATLLEGLCGFAVGAPVAAFLAYWCYEHVAGPQVVGVPALARGRHGHAALHPFSAWSSASVQGRLHGRSISLTFPQGRRTSGVSYGVEVANPGLDFELSKRSGLAALLDPIATADLHPALATNVVVSHGTRGMDISASTRGLLQHAEAATRLGSLLDAGFKVQLKEGRLAARLPRFPLFNGFLALTALHGAFTTLCEIAALCERRKVTAKFKDLSVKESFAVTAGGDSTALCPFCRDEVSLDGQGDDDLVACERCSTLHHRACFAEAKGCTIFGCRPRAPS